MTPLLVLVTLLQFGLISFVTSTPVNPHDPTITSPASLLKREHDPNLIGYYLIGYYLSYNGRETVRQSSQHSPSSPYG
jgi:hypothetical protein